MDQQTYSEIAELERTHWWYCARRSILGAIVSAELREGAPQGAVLDMGCGTGANLPVVARCGKPVGIDFSRLALTYAVARGGYAALLQADAGELPFSDATLDWVFAADILEHLDDGPAAAEINRVLKPGGRAIITVPAFPALWGPQDDVAHHRRRYTRSTLVQLVEGSGLEIRRLTFINSALFLPILIVRQAIRRFGLRVTSENTLHPGWSNPILEKVFAAEAWVVPRVSLPFGVSLLCVAARPIGPSRE
ncbi:class I SAM-dependent methyltransferase [soil metagenome]